MALGRMVDFDVLLDEKRKKIFPRPQIPIYLPNLSVPSTRMGVGDIVVRGEHIDGSCGAEFRKRKVEFMQYARRTQNCLAVCVVWYVHKW